MHILSFDNEILLCITAHSRLVLSNFGTQLLGGH